MTHRGLLDENFSKKRHLFIQKFAIKYLNFIFCKKSILFDFFLKFPILYEPLISKYKISTATVKKPNGLLQEPSHLVISECLSGFLRGILL
jgi:hypothetical protein